MFEFFGNAWTYVLNLVVYFVRNFPAIIEKRVVITRVDIPFETGWQDDLWSDHFCHGSFQDKEGNRSSRVYQSYIPLYQKYLFVVDVGSYKEL